MESLSFTIAERSDIPILSDVLREATQHKIRHEDHVWGPNGWTDEEIQDTLSESSVYIIRKYNEVVGSVSLQWEDERSWGAQPPIAGYMHRLAIKNGYHDQGLGEIIINWAATQVAQNGKDVLRLDCEEGNVGLCAYYEKLGFVKVGSRPVPEYGDYVAALYEKPASGRPNLVS